MTDRLIYPHKPISSLKALSGVLQIPEKLIVEVSNNPELYYKENPPLTKPDGRERVTYTLKSKIRIIQKSINKHIFTQVIYPAYLQGSIKDKKNPRTYYNDAKIHAGANLIVSEDVSDFFHSIDKSHVFAMWKYLFCFPPHIANTLTLLTTHNSYVPQGGVTSSYIANLILWDIEPSVVEKLKLLNIQYTRYIDDITLSTKALWLPKKDIQEALRLVFGMLGKKGVFPNRKKHQIMSKSNQMRIHKLNVNAGRPTLPRKKRNNIRMDIHNLLKLKNDVGRRSPVYMKRFNSVVGRVRELSRFHSNEAARYVAILNNVKPR